MNVGLFIAGILCFTLVIGHTTIGMLWVLPRLPADELPATPFGGGLMTSFFIKVTGQNTERPSRKFPRRSKR